VVGLCTTCPSRSICGTLCPEAELYAKQDEVEQRELTIGIPEYGRSPWEDSPDKPMFTRKERNILLRLLEEKSREEICQELGITQEALRMHLMRLKKKRNKKLLKIEGE
jgi:DNA-binding transcriptional ArsR family regulator